MEKKYTFKKHRILFLDFDAPIEKYPQMMCASLYRELSGWERNRFKIAEHFSGSDMSRWYGAWKHEINKYDTVFLCDGGRGPDIVSYLNKVSPNIRVIIYYVNTIFSGEKHEPTRYKGLNCEMYTFDIENARQYNINFKHFFYHYMSRENEDKTVDVTALSDIFFVGVDKNRLANLLKLKKQFTEIGLSCDFHIKRTHNSLYFPRQKKHTAKESIPYDEVIKRIKGCRAILEFVQEGQHGISYRALEAMFFGKKLITNCADIMEYPFYNTANIFVLGRRDINEISSFMAEPTVMVDKTILDEYVFENWLETFFT